MHSEQLSQLAERRPAPDRARGEVKATHGIDRFVEQAVLRHLVPVRSEHGDLGGHALIFTTGHLVEIMGYQNFHHREYPDEDCIMGKFRPRIR
jgi:hypothetical protein